MVLRQDPKNACLKPDLATSNPYQLHLIAYYIKKGNLNSTFVLQDGLLGKDLVITPKCHYRIFFM